MADFAPPPPGWTHDFAMAAEARMLTSGRYATVARQTVAPRKAVSLSHLRSRYLEQKRQGTCYAHSPVQLFEVSARSLGFEPFPASVRFVAYNTKQAEDRGNPSDGGSPTDAIRTMTDAGVGVAHEEECPYADDRNVLALRPSQAAFDDARKSHLQVPITVKSVDQVIALIDGQGGTVPGLPTANGYQCPNEMQDGGTFCDSVGGFLGGHSQLIWGYILPGVIDQYCWLELENWWSPLYAPLPPSVAKQVVGYEPVSANRTTSKWVRKDVYLRCCQQGCEHISATSVEGLLKNGSITPSDDLAKKLSDIFIA